MRCWDEDERFANGCVKAIGMVLGGLCAVNIVVGIILGAPGLIVGTLEVIVFCGAVLFVYALIVRSIGTLALFVASVVGSGVRAFAGRSDASGRRDPPCREEDK